MAVYKRHYKRYDGPITDERWRFTVLPRYSFRTAFESKGFTAFCMLCFMPSIIALIILYLRSNVDMLASVGMDTISGELRMTFGSSDLLRGFDFLVVVIGLFGISEILMTIEEGLAFKGKKASIDLAVVIRTWMQLPRYWLTMIRSAAVGCWMGVTPGGAVAASFMGYGLAKKFSRQPDSFGKGNPEGVLAPETAE